MSILSPMRLLSLIAGLLLVAFLSFFAPAVFAQAPGARDLAGIRLPPGFRISVFAGNLPGARSMALTPGGTLFVGTRQAGVVYAIRDRDRDGKADEGYIIASGMNMPNGVAFRNGALFVAEVNRILRYDGIEGRLDNPPAPVVVNDNSPAIDITDGNSSASGRTGASMCPWERPATSANPARLTPRYFGSPREEEPGRCLRGGCEIRWGSTGIPQQKNSGSPTTAATGWAMIGPRTS